MRELSTAEDELLLRAERRRRGARRVRARISALSGEGELVEALLGGLTGSSAARVRFRVALLERQIVVIRGVHGLPPVLALLADGQHQALTTLGLAQR